MEEFTPLYIAPLSPDPPLTPPKAAATLVINALIPVLVFPQPDVPSKSANYSRIENGKADPAFSSVVKIAKAMGVDLIDLFKADQVLKDVNSFDKSLTEKLSFIEQLDKKDKTAFYAVLDAFINKKKLKDTLSDVLSSVNG